MHPNYRRSITRSAFAALAQPVLMNRLGVPACAQGDGFESQVLMR